MIAVADPVTTEKPPEYDTVVVLEPPCYDDAIKLNPANLLKTKCYQDISLPNYDDLEINEQCSPIRTNSHQQCNSVIVNEMRNNVSPTNNNTNTNQNELNVTNSSSSCSQNAFTVITIVQSASNSSNEHSITQKTTDCDSVASESIVMS